jgi:glutaconate CoA-transferase subunit B
MTADHDDAELALAWMAARLIDDGEVAFVGIGAPALAAMIAIRRHAPNLTMIFESGVIGANPDTAPLSTGSPSVAQGAAMIGDMLDAFATLQQGRIDVGLLSAAEVDRHGNLNSTVIGPYAAPKLRLPGSGGAHDIALLARRVVIVMPHEPKRFVARVSFNTSPGHADGAGAGRRPDLHGGGPAALATDKAWFAFENGEMTLAGLRAGVSADEATAGFGWTVPRRTPLEIVPGPDLAARRAFARMTLGGQS